MSHHDTYLTVIILAALFAWQRQIWGRLQGQNVGYVMLLFAYPVRTILGKAYNLATRCHDTLVPRQGLQLESPLHNFFESVGRCVQYEAIKSVLASPTKDGYFILAYWHCVGLPTFYGIRVHKF